MGDKTTATTKPETKTLAQLDAEWQAARGDAFISPTRENRDRVIAAWNAREAAAPKRKVSGFASRAGRRQAAERRGR